YAEIVAKIDIERLTIFRVCGWNAYKALLWNLMRNEPALNFEHIFKRRASFLAFREGLRSHHPGCPPDHQLPQIQPWILLDGQFGATAFDIRHVEQRKQGMHRAFAKHMEQKAVKRWLLRVIKQPQMYW